MSYLRSFVMLTILPIFLCFWVPAIAQQRTITGRITDFVGGQGIQGASITVKGSSIGTQTNSDGAFSITVPPNASTLVISSVGFVSQEIDIAGREIINITLTGSNIALNEVVIVGYGTQRRRDLTGSVTSITEKDFNQGPITTPEQLIMGKAAGVQVTSNGGAPGSGSRIRIRGGSSLNASNDPLIVIDGVPVDNNSISGASNPLSFINPNDIESFNILKDASATAIYGSRASNGVIIITTKKGSSGKPRVSFSTLNSISKRTGSVDVLSADQLRDVINDRGTPSQIALLGEANTDWQDVIFRTAFSTDNNISVSGAIRSLPFRVSLGYLNQDGILKTSNLKRTSASINLSPKFFDNHLSVNVNVKGAINKSRFADQGAIGAAVFFDPTQPVYSDSAQVGGYFEWFDPSITGPGQPYTLASKNPLSILEQRRDMSNANRIIGNIQLDYKFHFLPELRANLNIGYDRSNGEGDVIVPATLASAFYTEGNTRHYEQSKKNKLLEFYLNYTKDLESIKSRVDLTAGYSYQDWKRDEPFFPTINGNGTMSTGLPFRTQNTLISAFGRLNYAFNDRYLLTATVRRDGSSRFSPDTRWGTFPSAAFAWRISEESFLRNSKTVSDLKLRIGYGVTGQQDITGGDYPYLPRYTLSDSGATYQFGDTYYLTYRPEGYDERIKWEETEAYNIGLDFGFIEGRISGSIDYYFKKTKDLLAVIAIPAGSNLTNQILTNVGNIENKGVEFVLNTSPVRNEDFTWNANFNITYNESKITNLSKLKDSGSIGYPVGGIGGGVGNTIQIHTVGYNPSAFYVYKQVYDGNGRPIEGLFADIDSRKDGVINANDKYRYKTPEPRVFLGFSSQFDYKQWNLGFALRGSIGNYMYNNFNANNGAYKSFQFQNYLGNLPSNVLETNFAEYQTFSDYFIENASFLRMDYINFGYNFGSLMNEKVNVRLSANIQNVFVVTKYSGMDPEIAGGIDNNFYPRPRIFSLGLNLDF